MHDADPTNAEEPLSHGRQSSKNPGEYVPASHGMHFVRSMEGFDPGKQTKQSPFSNSTFPVEQRNVGVSVGISVEVLVGVSVGISVGDSEDERS